MLVRGEVVCGGEVVERSGPVVPQTSGRQKGAASPAGVDSVDLCLKQVGVELLLRAASLNVAMATVELRVNLPQGACVGECSVERCPSLCVAGCLVSLAVVPPRATWADAERAIKVDVLRSLLARVELLSQEISRQGQEGDPVFKAEESVQLGFPRRVAVTMDSAPFPLSDYCFEDESDKVPNPLTCPSPSCVSRGAPPPAVSRGAPPPAVSRGAPPPPPPQECVQRLGELLSVTDLSSLEVTSVEGRAAPGGEDRLEEGHGGTPPTPSPSAGKGKRGLDREPT